jgi:DNA helicase HerA-like ATPase
MGKLSESLSNLLSAYVQAHAPTRALTAGIPESLFEEIANLWPSTSKLFLVSDKKYAALPAHVRVIKPDDLTAERQSGWAALVSPSQSRIIQESIRSAGAGTVREVWAAGFPWHPCELPGVRWADLRDEFIRNLGLSANTKHAADCINCFRGEMRGEVDRTESFFNDLNGVAGPAVSVDNLCYYLGIPKHREDQRLRDGENDVAVLAVLESFLEHYSEDGAEAAGQHFNNVCSAVLAGDSRQPLVLKAIDFFTEKFRVISAREAVSGIRVWRAAFRSGRSHWETLDSDVLSALVGSQSSRPVIRVRNIATGTGTEIFQIGDTPVLIRAASANHTIIASLEYNNALVSRAAEAAASGSPFKQFVSRNNDTGVQFALPSGSGPHNFEVALNTPGKQVLRFSAGENSTSRERALAKPVTIWESCQDFPLILVHSQARVALRKRKKIRNANGDIEFESEEQMVFPTEGRVVLHGFVYGLQGKLTYLSSEGGIRKEVPTTHSSFGDIVSQFHLVSDAVEGLSLTFEWTTSGYPHRATVTFDFKDEAGPEDGSIIELLLEAHGGGRSSAKAHFEKVKRGEKVIPEDIPINITAKPIARWEVDFARNKDTGWWPLLASTSSNCSEQKFSESAKNYCRFSSALELHQQANAWNSIINDTIDPGPPPSEIAAYQQARSKVIQALESQFAVSGSADLEAVNIARLALISELPVALLQDYIEAFQKLLASAKSGQLHEDWRWHAWAADSILLFSKGKNCPEAHLLGPFHPITLSSLFFGQRCLVERFLGGDLTSLAHVLIPSEPIAIGHTLDGQRQPAAAISFPVGDPHWLWIFARRVEVDVPSKDAQLMNWLRRQGFDPHAGPLGVDADVLPQSLRQYAVAHPARQSLRLFLEDCSQQIFKELRTELDATQIEGDDEALARKLSGGIEVFDPVSRVDMLDGEALCFDSELPLRWYHKAPPAELPVDIATLPPSSKVDFQQTSTGGVCARWMPTTRKSLVDFGPNGLEVASSLNSIGAADLESATVEMMSLFEAPQVQLAWGSSLISTGTPRANWTLCSSSRVDPRLFIEYVQRNRNPAVALWTYKLFQLGKKKSLEFGKGHFLLAKVSSALSNSLQACLSALGISFKTDDLLVSLAEAGLTLGDEFLRTGRAAEGAIGQFLVERLIWQPAGDTAPLPHWTLTPEGELDSAGFLLQVDPFKEALEALAKAKRDVASSKDTLGENDAILLPAAGQTGSSVVFASNQRSDLVSWHVRICGHELWIKPVVLESKCYPAGNANIKKALEQAEATANLIDNLLSYCQIGHQGRPSYWATPERLLLAELIHLGLRLSRGSFAGSADKWHEFERKVLQCVLSGEYKFLPARLIAIVHSKAPTKDEIYSNDPHALISLADANSAISGAVLPAYDSVKRSLAKLLRHVCVNSGADKPDQARNMSYDTVNVAPVTHVEIQPIEHIPQVDVQTVEPEMPQLEIENPTNGQNPLEGQFSEPSQPKPTEYLPQTGTETNDPSSPPDNIIGAGAVGNRWAILGKLAGTSSTVALDLDQPKAIGIFGYMGSGKSYLLGNIIESSVHKIHNINALEAPLAAVVFNYRRNAADRFELSSLSEPNTKQDETTKLASDYRSHPTGVQDVHVVALPGELSKERLNEYGPVGSQELFFNPSSLGAEDWALLMGDPTSDSVFARTIKNTLVDLRSSGSLSFEALQASVLARLTQASSRNAASLRFDFVRRYLSAERGCDFSQLIKPGRVLVFDLRAPLFDKDDALRFFLICANHISQTQGKFNKLIVFDEAHEYLSDAFCERMESRIRLMRHEGTSYVFATQDASSIPSNISRFLSTLFVFDMGTQENSEDLVRLSGSFADENLVGMKPGKCLVKSNLSSQRFFNKPREIDVRPRATQHGGRSRIYS